ncbi:MAG: type IV toxin-antitoxin system AbiEi family antitoxin [Halobacteriales archaeon]|nr:type IV toxin-antitoxin system AbiEi family antitoxin [Halobacteriales archaeon]
MGTKSEESINRGLSKREALALTRLAAEGKTVITIEDIETTLDISYEQAKKVANSLVKKKWLDRLKGGTYLIVPLEAGEEGRYTEHEFVIASHLAEPMYISYWSALNYHDLTEQVPTTVFSATTEKAPEREIHGVTYKFVTVTEDKFFGYRKTDISAHKINVATPEKAVVDCSDHPEYCGGITELAKAVRKLDELDKGKLSEFLLRQGNGAAVKRVVYLADLYGIELSRREELEEEFTKGYSKLEPTRTEDGKHSHKYRLKLNVSENKLMKVGEIR